MARASRRTSAEHHYARLPAGDEAAYPPEHALGPQSARWRHAHGVIFVLALSTAILLALVIVLASQSRPHFVDPALLLVGAQWRTFNADTTAVLPPYEHAAVYAQRFLSPACADAWVARGELCPEAHGVLCPVPREAAVDVVWSWVNGSSPLLSAWRDAYLLDDAPPALLDAGGADAAGGARRDLYRPPARAASPGTAANHFRTHRELLYSLRSSLSLAPEVIRARTLFTGDVAISDAGLREGQVPAWLDLEGDAAAGVGLAHHFQAFRTRAAESPEQWRADALPTFNSLALESQLGHLDVGETMLYMNDDSFITANLTLADLATPLSGPVIRLQADLLVSGRELRAGAQAAALEGEWPALEHTALLLDRRFGARPRPYAAHVSKVLSRPLLLEMEAVWGADFAATAATRSRGRAVGLHVSFMAQHYLVERHREALLWSFLCGRRLPRPDLVALLSQAGDARLDNGSIVVDVAWPNRTTLADLDVAHRQAGLEPAGATEALFTSADGYAFVALDDGGHLAPSRAGAGMGFAGVAPPASADGFQRWPQYTDARRAVACRLDLDRCFPPAVDEPASLLRHVAFADPQCGDCLIVALLRLSGGRGLDAFLPQASSEMQETPPPLGGLAATWQEAEYGPATRAAAVSQLQRYSYLVGNSHSRFLVIRQPSTLRANLDELDRAKLGDHPPAFAVLNDDVKGAIVSVVDRTLADWFAKRWPAQAPWERRPPDRGAAFVE